MGAVFVFFYMFACLFAEFVYTLHTTPHIIILQTIEILP